MKKIYLVLFTLLWNASFLCSQESPDSGKLTAPTILQLNKQRENLKKSASADPFIRAYVKIKDESVIDSLVRLGVKINSRASSVITAEIPVGIVEKVTAFQNVVCVQGAQKVFMQMDKSRIETGVEDIQAVKPPLKLPYSGKNVIVGIIDGGVDYGHPAFYTSDRSELRLKRVWDQNIEDGTPPADFGYGSEYATTDDILAAETDMQYFSHGTHVAGIAAGADTTDGNPYYGIARDAHLAFSTFKDIDVGITNGIKYIFDYARSEGKPAVINMSLGTQIGPHDGTSLRDVMADELQGDGYILVGAAGNEALINLHISKTFTEEDRELRTGVAFIEGGPGYAYLDIWGEEGKTFRINVCTFDKTTEKTVYKSRTYDASQSYSQTVTLQKPFDQVGGYFSIVTQTSPLNNKPNAYLEIAMTDYKPGKVVGIIITGEPGTTVHGWADHNYCCYSTHNLQSLHAPDNFCSPAEIGGTGKSIITVGAYVTKEEYTAQDGTVNQTGYTEGDIAPFSNHGPTPDGRMKPDISAPGSMVISAYSQFDGTVVSRVSTHTWNGKPYYYGAYQGTSMAAPQVTGIIATWLQAAPDLSADDIREIFSKTAVRDEYVEAGGENTWGYGKVDAYGGLIECLNHYVTGTESPGLPSEEMVVNRIDGRLRMLFATGAFRVQAALYTPGGRLTDRFVIGTVRAGDEYVIPLARYARGFYLLQVSSENGQKTFKILNY